MVTRTIVKLVDDLDNKELDGDGTTVRFGFQNSLYELDLSTKNVEKLQEALAPFVAAARRVNGPQAHTPTSNGKSDPEQLRGMRQWARQHGFTVSERGRVAKEVQDAYHAATS